MSEKMSQEKLRILKSLGAEVIRTPTGAPVDSPNSTISVARRLQSQRPNSHILDQHTNPSNPLCHELGTAREIWEQCDGKVDVVIAGAGTGGTVTGLSRGMRKYNSKILVVGVDAVGSILAQPEELNQHSGDYKLEGIGYDFVPDVLDRNTVDAWIKSTDDSAFRYARRLIREEGLLCGGSSGAAVAAVVDLLKARPELNREDVRIVVILPDGIRNYLSKFVDDSWMTENGFLP
ncbi:hypothetical protein CDD80_1998 [Ophiocordyceps camponoti-rufipedis]|uniref:Tryptophan synthase beta chain-like PALP domain-containing protein n=1 Tax=Ophiocordyceps camponoti-rufipedis TaxID=2004952 RepID=A0A2C5Z857_9HYPO|nr:hypothetical protein CDD80_1998 [Ophiocordyceps camponoti-rufipedis]